MNDTTLSKIKGRLKETEGTVKHPYLDSNDLVTAGVGFNVDKKSDFTALDFWTRDRDGTERRAKPGEKATAFDQMTAAREANKGKHNRPADSYRKATSLFLPADVMEKTLDDKAKEHMAGAKNDVGEDAWNKLNDSQKTAVTDIRYANGSLDKFTKLKDAVQEGDAKKMAEESTFFTDSKTGKRPLGRLERNFQALSGLSREESDKRLQDVLKKNDTARKSSPIGNATPPVKPAPTQKPGTSGGDGPTGDVQPQSHDLTNDPNAASKTLELKLGPDGKPISEGLTPEQNILLKDFDKNDGPLDDILAKDPRDLTQEEFLELKKEVVRLPAGAEQEQLDGMAMEFLEDKFGTGPAKIDAVGRMIDPEPIRPINKTPVPAKTPDGEPLTGALKRIGKAVAGNAGNDGSATAVQALQTGLNILKQVMLRNGDTSKNRTPGIIPDVPLSKRPPFSTILVSDLKADGIVGPKTRRALKLATSRLGTPKIEEGLALGRFGRFARDVQTGRDDTRKLGSTIVNAFGPLFGTGKPLPKPGENTGIPLIRPDLGRGENTALQATVNDLGLQSFGRDKFKPIKEDGFIGPKTESAFNTVLPAAGPDTFTSRLGHHLGFFDFDD